MRVIASLLVAALAAWLAAPAAGPDAPAKQPPAVNFGRDVLPILDAKCNRCHGTKQHGGKLDLRTRAAMLKGGVSGPAVVPGDPNKSMLVELIYYNEMPPKKVQPRVTADELKLLKAWIAAGASDQ